MVKDPGLTDKALMGQLLEQVAHLTEKVKELDALEPENERPVIRVRELEQRPSKYESPKDSGNSSVAPSQDPYRRTKSLRGRSKKRPGGQKGHKGSKLGRVGEYQADHCGGPLTGAPIGHQARQVFDLRGYGWK